MGSPVISLTTIPSRIEHIEPCIASLVAQGYPVHLWVAKQELWRSGKVLETIPQPLLDSGAHITIVEDRGPITKLLPALEAGFDRIITADDDHVYGPHWADGLLEWQRRRPNTVVCYRGRNFDHTRLYSNSRVITRTHRAVDFITSVSGVIYRRKFFADSIFNEWKEWLMNDDIVVCAHLHRRRIPIEVVPFPKGCTVERLPVAYVNPLCGPNVHRGMNDAGLQKVYWND